MRSFILDAAKLKRLPGRRTYSINYYFPSAPPLLWWLIQIPKTDMVIANLLSAAPTIQGIRFELHNITNPAIATITWDGYTTGADIKSGVLLTDAVIAIFAQSPPASTRGLLGIVAGIGKLPPPDNAIVTMIDAYGLTTRGDIKLIGGGGENLTPCRIPAN